MDHGDNDKRFYVYLHKDKDGNVRYVGSGSHSRIVSNSSRTKEHLELWPELEKVKIAEGLTKQEAREFEDELLKELGKFKMGKGCIYVKKLSDINQDVLKKMMQSTIDFLQSEYGPK